MWGLVVSVPDHCLSFYFSVFYFKDLCHFIITFSIICALSESK